MQYTTNLRLRKPGLDDNIDVRDLNENMDIIDDAITSGPAEYEVTIDSSVDIMTMLSVTATYVAYETAPEVPYNSEPIVKIAAKVDGYATEIRIPVYRVANGSMYESPVMTLWSPAKIIAYQIIIGPNALMFRRVYKYEA